MHQQINHHQRQPRQSRRPRSGVSEAGVKYTDFGFIDQQVGNCRQQDNPNPRWDLGPLSYFFGANLIKKHEQMYSENAKLLSIFKIKYIYLLDWQTWNTSCKSVSCGLSPEILTKEIIIFRLEVGMIVDIVVRVEPEYEYVVRQQPADPRHIIRHNRQVTSDYPLLDILILKQKYCKPFQIP